MVEKVIDIKKAVSVNSVRNEYISHGRGTWVKPGGCISLLFIIIERTLKLTLVAVGFAYTSCQKG